ncbi:hypothetical protein ACIRD3_10625 [Kitasatospora sp. NPDC093550]|uniref:hypothetical protein n=1 Tax=Kitasatospora sp. NPDC093550 TaxID=3364089 RepID=UPI0037FDD9CD
MSRSFRIVPSLVAATAALVLSGAAVAAAADAPAGPSARVSVAADGAGTAATPHTEPGATPTPTGGPGSNGWW